MVYGCQVARNTSHSETGERQARSGYTYRSQFRDYWVISSCGPFLLSAGGGDGNRTHDLYVANVAL